MVVFDLTKNQKQQVFFDAFWKSVNGTLPYRYFFYGGAIRGGKTSLILNIFYLLARKFPKSRWHIIRESFTDLEDTTIPSWNKFFSGSKFISNVSRSKNNYHVDFKNGSTVFFKSESFIQDPLLSWMDGLETNGIFLEQMEGLSQTCFNKSIERIGSWYIPDMPIPILAGSFNPTQTWVKQKVYLPYKKGTLPEKYLFVEALPDDNPFVTGEQWEGWKQMDSISYKQRIEGDWDAFASTFAWAYAFDEDKHTADNIQQNKAEPLYISFDFNHSPVTCTIWQHYDNKIRCLYELGSNNGLTDLCRQIKELVGWENNELKTICYVTGDMSGWSHSAVVEGNRTAYDIITSELNLTKYQVQAPRSNPNQLKARELTNSIFEKHPDILVDKIHCPKLIFDLRFVESDDQHKIIKDRNKEAGKADYLDAAKYYLCTYHQEFVRL